MTEYTTAEWEEAAAQWEAENAYANSTPCTRNGVEVYPAEGGGVTVVDPGDSTAMALAKGAIKVALGLYLLT